MRDCWKCAFMRGERCRNFCRWLGESRATHTGTCTKMCSVSAFQTCSSQCSSTRWWGNRRKSGHVFLGCLKAWIVSWRRNSNICVFIHITQAVPGSRGWWQSSFPAPAQVPPLRRVQAAEGLLQKWKQTLGYSGIVLSAGLSSFTKGFIGVLSLE